MSFATEVPGEANPLSAEQVYLALQAASSSHPLQIQSGTKQLQGWECREGYYPLLQAVYCDRSLPLEVRYLAIIQLKNGIDRYWRKSATAALNDHDKSRIRPRLLPAGIEETHPNLALQNALVIAKVIRIDYPTVWSDVFTTLLDLIRQDMTDRPRLRRCMLILHHAVKELASARLARFQSNFRSIAPEIVHVLSTIYSSNVQFWLSSLSAGDEESAEIEDHLRTSLCAVKILRRLLVAGYERPHHDDDVQAIWQRSRSQFDIFVASLTLWINELSFTFAHLLEAHVLQLAKLHLGMLEAHPAAFVLLPRSIALCKLHRDLVESLDGEVRANAGRPMGRIDNWASPGANQLSILDRLYVRSLSILRRCVNLVHSPTHTFKYTTPEAKLEQQQAREVMRTELLTPNFVIYLVSFLVQASFVLRMEDLQSWDDDEDELAGASGDGYHDFDIRPCAEKLFSELVVAYEDLLVDPLIRLFHSVGPMEPMTDLLRRDAIYTAMGLSAPVIYKHFDFDAFLDSTVVNDVTYVVPYAKVLRRRIAILVSQWVTVKLGNSKRPLVYQIYKHLLTPESDLNDDVVRVAAARHFKNVIDDIAFEADAFLPFAPDVLSLLMKLVQEVESTDTRLAILETIRAIAARLDHQIVPFADDIVKVLPELWDASGDEHLLKQGILSLMSSVVASMRGQAERYHSLVLPLIKRAVEPGSDMQVYLLEDALDLWAMLLAQVKGPPSNEVTELVPYTLPLLEMGSESLRVVLGILESYNLLAPEAVLHDHTRKEIISRLRNLLQKPKREVAGLATTVLEDMIRQAYTLGNSAGLGVVIRDLHDSGLLQQIMDGLKNAWEAHETTGPERQYPELDGVVETDFFTVLARIALADPNLFWAMLASMGEAQDLWRWLSTEWFRHFDSMANIERQKLSCLALTRFLELQPPTNAAILDNLQNYFTMWTSVISEMSSDRTDGGDNLIWNPHEGNADEVPEGARKRMHATADEVHRLHTLNFVRERLQMAVAMCGGDEVFQQHWLVNLDRDVLSAFQNLGNIAENHN